MQCSLDPKTVPKQSSQAVSQAKPQSSPKQVPKQSWHHSVKRLINVLCLENVNSWERNLSRALLVLRTSLMSQLIFLQPNLYTDGISKLLRLYSTKCGQTWKTRVTKYIFTLINRLKRFKRSQAKDWNLIGRSENSGTTQAPLSEALSHCDLVLVINTARTNKMSVNWIGPGTIESKLFRC